MDFISKFIEPWIPSRDRFQAWIEWIEKGLFSSQIVVVRRFGTLRRTEPRNFGGIEVLASDLSPVWALHQAMLHSDPPEDKDFKSWINELPLAHNDVRARRLDMLNRAGLHAAHLVDVAAYRGLNWNTDDLGSLRRQCLIELHPLNVFWIPKARWQYWGADSQIKAHFAAYLKHHVGDRTWNFFAKRDGIERVLEQLPIPDPDLRYCYSDADWSRRCRAYTILHLDTNISTHQVRQIVALLANHPKRNITEQEVRTLLENGKQRGEFITTQDVLKVFDYYRNQLRDDGVLAW